MTRKSYRGTRVATGLLVGCLYSADADSPHSAAGGQGQLRPASWTLPTRTDPLKFLTLRVTAAAMHPNPCDIPVIRVRSWI